MDVKGGFHDGCRATVAEPADPVRVMAAHRGRVVTGRSGRRRAAAALAAVAVAASGCALLAGRGVAVAAGAAGGVRVHWGRALEVPGTAVLNAGGNARLLAVSCWRAGYCAAGGFYTDASGHQQAFVVIQSNGGWRRALEVPGTAVLNAGGGAQVTSVSCAPGGYCAAAGQYNDSKQHQQAFVVSESRGRWGAAQEIPGSGKLNVGGFASVHSVSCPSAGNCAAGGFYQTYLPPGVPPGDESQAFVVSERDGRWGRAEEVPGIAALAPPPEEDDAVRSVSCASAGNCTAGGSIGGNTSRPTAPGFVLSEVGGRWHRLVQPKGGGEVDSVSCWHPGDCLAAGGGFAAGGGGFAEVQASGRWGKARGFTAVQSGWISSVSCPSAGNCAAGGILGFDGAGNSLGAFVLSERNGRWGKEDRLAGPAGTGSIVQISCASAGNCGSGGWGVAGQDEYGDYFYDAFVAGQRDGRWTASAAPPGEAALNVGGNSVVNAVSCASASTCVAGGFYTDPAGRTQAFIDGSR